MTPTLQNKKNNEHWHLDKRVPIVLIVTIIVQTIVVVWYASKLATQVEQNTMSIIRIETKQDSDRRDISNNSTNIAVINENLRHIAASLGNIERLLQTKAEGD